jgi:hypothetical protein
MSAKREVIIKSSYVDLRSFHLGSVVIKDDGLLPGRVTVRLEQDADFSTEGTIDARGFLSGMAKVYKRLNLAAGSKLEFSVANSALVVIHSPSPSAPVAPTADTIFDRCKLKHIYLEPFRPGNLHTWEPENETDVYLVFGVLQEHTDYQYCCAASKQLLDRLGANYSDKSKPDAVLIDRVTGQYLMAEWKKFSSDFKSNHAAGDVDVLVCWQDQETDRTKLPPRVLALQKVAREAAELALEE